MNAGKQFIEILEKIKNILKDSNNIGQANIVDELITLLLDNKYKEYEERVNNVDIWGGSGAVWEVNIDGQTSAIEFENLMISLIDLLEKENMLHYFIGARRVRRLFLENKQK